MPPRGAGEQLRVFGLAALFGHCVERLLGVHVSETSLDRGQFIAADAAIDKLLSAGLGVGTPASVRALDDRDRQGPVAVTYQECGAAQLLSHHIMLLVESDKTPLALPRIRQGVTEI